jgi:hypothetical protein
MSTALEGRERDSQSQIKPASWTVREKKRAESRKVERAAVKASFMRTWVVSHWESLVDGVWVMGDTDKEEEGGATVVGFCMEEEAEEHYDAGAEGAVEAED